MQYDKSIKNINDKLKKYSLDFLENGVKWIIVTGETTESRYELYCDTIYVHPDDIGWSWTFGKTAYAILYHELGHRYAERILTRKLLRRKDIVELFGHYHKKYIRRLRYASKARQKDMFDFPSRYALVHPADDFAEIFSTCLQYITKDEDPTQFVRDKLKSEICKNKILKMLELFEYSKEQLKENEK